MRQARLVRLRLSRSIMLAGAVVGMGACSGGEAAGGPWRLEALASEAGAGIPHQPTDRSDRCGFKLQRKPLRNCAGLKHDFTNSRGAVSVSCEHAVGCGTKRTDHEPAFRVCADQIRPWVMRKSVDHGDPSKIFGLADAAAQAALQDDIFMVRGPWPGGDRPYRFPYLAHC